MGTLIKFCDTQLLNACGKYYLLHLRNFAGKKSTISKRPASAFGMYLKDKKELIAEKTTNDASILNEPILKNVMKTASDMWRSEPDALHQYYKQKFTEEMNDYKQNLPVIRKRPPAPFIMFSNDQSEVLRLKYPDITERSKVVSKMWKNLSLSEKQRYENIYKEKMIVYQDSLTDEEKVAIKEKKARSIKRKNLKEKKKYSKESLLNRPIRPSNSWVLFMKENLQSVPNGENKFAFLSQRWNGLTADEKAIYEAKYNSLKTQYDKDINQWQQKYT
ncbi:HMG box-containing protein 5 isoform X1 [Hydra vulgaris]|uniref:HMG box-containing protein 5 isoform X1 n=2 Tax=Hydra vulgaris TaxID=6087 RepID=UPI00019247A3